jgi:hypothetical protein
LNPPAGKQRIASDEERVWAVAPKVCENRIDLTPGGGVENLGLHPHGVRSMLDIF